MRTILDIYHNGKTPTFESEEELRDFFYHLGKLVLHSLFRGKEDSANYVLIYAADLEDVTAVFNRPVPMKDCISAVNPLRGALTTPGKGFTLGMVRHRDGKYGMHS